MEDKLLVTFIIEILGKPVEHVEEALNTLVVKIGSEKGVNITNKILHEPKPAQDSKTLYTAFVEIDAELDSLQDYISMLFTYLPSHIEITNPEKMILSNVQLNDLGNTITQRMHHYDAVTKNTVAERNYFLEKLNQVAPHLIPPQIQQQLAQQSPQQPQKESPSKKPKNQVKSKSKKKN